MIRSLRSALAVSCFGCAISFSTLHLHAQNAPQPTAQQPQATQGGQIQQPRVIQSLDQLTPQQRQQYEQMQQQAWQESERQRQYQLQLQQQQRQLQQQDPRMAQQPGGVNRTQYIDGGNPSGQNPTGPAAGQPVQNPQPMGPGAINPGQGGNTIGTLAPVPNAGATMPMVQLQPRNPLPLTPEEEQTLNKVLIAWENANAAIKTFKCDFKLWEFNATWGPKDAVGNDLGIAIRESVGVLRYEAPDKGQYRTTDTKVYNQDKKAYESTGADDLKYWACDGKSMYTIDNKKKERRKYNLPENLRGSAITEGPLPFVFGLKAEKLKARYWMKVITPSNQAGKQVWIQAIPKFSADAFNYHKLEVILEANSLNPTAIQIHKPGGKEREIYELMGHSINANGIIERFFGPGGIVPDLPRGYKDVEDNFVDPVAAQAQARANGRPALNGQGVNTGGQAPRPMQPGNVPQIGHNNLQPNNPGQSNPQQNPVAQNPNYAIQTGNNVQPNYQPNNLPANGSTYPNNYNPYGQNPNGTNQNPNPTNQAMGPGAPLR